jgi:hypothetical protein
LCVITISTSKLCASFRCGRFYLRNNLLFAWYVVEYALRVRGQFFQLTWKVQDYSSSNYFVWPKFQYNWQIFMIFLVIYASSKQRIETNMIICSSLWCQNYVLRLFWIFYYSVIPVILTTTFNRIKPFIWLKYVHTDW